MYNCTRILLLLLPLMALSCLDQTETQAKTISIMSYNLENLFDTVHDHGKNDYTYLPLAMKETDSEIQAYCKSLRNSYYRKNCLTFDWNDDVLEQKVLQLGRVIRSMTGGLSPDILVLQEVENKNVLAILREKALRYEGYKEIVLLEGPDNRGIDAAILSKFPLAEIPELHIVDVSDINKEQNTQRQPVFMSPTRGVLEAVFKVYGNELRVIANHWPSQSNPDIARERAAKVVMNVTKKRDLPTVVVGDFNTLYDDKPNAVDYLLKGHGKYYVYEDAMTKSGKFAGFPQGEVGSHNYKGEWSWLDRILVHTQSFEKHCTKKNCITPLWDSFERVMHPFMLHEKSYTDFNTGDVVTLVGVPYRFDPETGEGFSDHLPVLLKFNAY